MLDEFPETLGLVFIDNINPFTDWFLDAGSALRKLIALVLLLKASNLIVLIQNDSNVPDIVSVGEVHVAVSFGVINPQAVVIVNFVAFLLVRAVRDDFEDDLARQIFSKL